MCPACMGTAAMVVAGATSTGGLLALAAAALRRARASQRPRTDAPDAPEPHGTEMPEIEAGVVREPRPELV
jgi:hypothetical protein